MRKIGLRSSKDVIDFYRAFNEKDWDWVFLYLKDDVIWEASERTLHGRTELIAYWSDFHASFKEILDPPENIIVKDNRVYLQVNIKLEFLTEGSFQGQTFQPGDTYNFRCADYYELDEEGMLVHARIFSRFPRR